MAEQIKMLFGVNTLGGPWNVVLDGGPDPPQQGEEDSMQPLPNYFDPVCFLIHSVNRVIASEKFYIQIIYVFYNYYLITVLIEILTSD